MQNKTLAFVDIETTGLRPLTHEILEVAIVREFPDGTVDEWCSKVMPNRLYTADSKALDINGYTEREWRGSPSLYQVIPEIASRLEGTLPVAHNAGFDKSFLDPLLEGHSAPHHWLDTVTLAHMAFPDSARYSLAFLCETLGISNAGAHRALADARRCRLLYKELEAALTGPKEEL